MSHSSAIFKVLSSFLAKRGLYNFVGICNARDSHEDREPSVIVFLLQVYGVWMESTLTSSRATSRCIVGFQATERLIIIITFILRG